MAFFRATIGADFLAKVVYWDEDTTLRLQLWDIAGEDNKQNTFH
jgi:Ras-related protein Rab-32